MLVLIAIGLVIIWLGFGFLGLALGTLYLDEEDFTVDVFLKLFGLIFGGVVVLLLVTLGIIFKEFDTSRDKVIFKRKTKKQ